MARALNAAEDRTTKSLEKVLLESSKAFAVSKCLGSQIMSSSGAQVTGTKLDEFNFLKVLGCGAFGKVFKVSLRPVRNG